MCRACLAVAPDDRPADAGVVCARVGAYLVAVEERAHRAELAAAAARAKAGEERRARRLAVGLGIAIVTTLLAVLAVVCLRAAERERQRGVAQAIVGAIERADSLAQVAAASTTPDPRGWAEALSVIEQARQLALRVDDEALRARIASTADRLENGHDAAVRDDRMSRWLDRVRQHIDDAVGARASIRRSAGCSGRDRPARHGHRRDAEAALAASPLRVRLAAALDDWARMRATLKDAVAADWHPLVELAMRVDPEPRRTKLRRAWLDGDVDALLAFARSGSLAELEPATLDQLAGHLLRAKRVDEAVRVARLAQQIHPDDFWIEHDLAASLRALEPPPHDEIIRACAMATSLRPGDPHSWTDLGYSFWQSGDTARAMRSLRRALALDASYGRASWFLALILLQSGDLPGMVAVCRDGLHADPADGRLWRLVARAASMLGAVGAADHAWSRVLEFDPDGATEARMGLATAASLSGGVDRATALLRQVVADRPEFAEAHCNLARELVSQRRFDEALAEFERGDALGRSRGTDWPYPSEEWVDVARRLAGFAASFEPVPAPDLDPPRRAERALVAFVLGHPQLAAKEFGGATAGDANVGDRFIGFALSDWFIQAAAATALGRGDAAGLDAATRRGWSRIVAQLLHDRLAMLGWNGERGDVALRGSLENLHHWLTAPPIAEWLTGGGDPVAAELRHRIEALQRRFAPPIEWPR